MILLLAIAIVVFTHGCAEDKIADPAEKIADSTNDLVLVQVDLQNGFAGKLVYVKFNEMLYFQAMLYNGALLAGPEAMFLTHLQRGLNNLSINGRIINNGESYRDDIDVNLGNAEKYYLGVSIYSDTLIVVVQDSPFGYM